MWFVATHEMRSEKFAIPFRINCSFSHERSNEMWMRPPTSCKCVIFVANWGWYAECVCLAYTYTCRNRRRTANTSRTGTSAWSRWNAFGVSHFRSSHVNSGWYLQKPKSHTFSVDFSIAKFKNNEQKCFERICHSPSTNKFTVRVLDYDVTKNATNERKFEWTKKKKSFFNVSSIPSRDDVNVERRCSGCKCTICDKMKICTRENWHRIATLILFFHFLSFYSLFHWSCSDFDLGGDSSLRIVKLQPHNERNLLVHVYYSVDNFTRFTFRFLATST